MSAEASTEPEGSASHYSEGVKSVLRWRPDLAHLALFAIILGGAIVRFVGLDFGLPLTIKSDEPIVVSGAMGMLERRSFEPDKFQWPNHLGIMATYLAYVFVTPLWHGMLAEQAITDVEIGYFHLIARGVTATFGVVSIVLAYLIGKRFTRSIGLVSAALFAFMPHYVEESHYATPDIGLTMAVLGTVLLGILYLEKPTTRRLLILSALSAVAILAKYPGALTTLIIATVVIIAAIRERQWWRIVQHGAISLLTIPVTLFLLSPSLFTNRHRVIRSLGFESRGEHLGADGLTFVEKLQFYLSYYLGGTGWLLLALAVVGAVWVVRERKVIALPLLIGLVFWGALSTLGLHWTRWSLPMFITPLFFSAIGAYAFTHFVRHRFPQYRLAHVGAVALVGVILLTQVMSSVATSAAFLRKDVRVIALGDFASQGITPENTAFEGYTPFLPGGFGTIFEDFTVVDGALVPTDLGIRFVVLSDSMYGRYQAEGEFDQEQEFYRLLEQEFTLIAEYQPQTPDVSFPLSGTRLGSSIESLIETGLGATGGPVLKVYEVGD